MGGRRRVSRVVAGLAALAGLAAPAEAASVYQLRALGPTMAFDRFDPSLGELEAATYTLTASVPFRYQVTSALPAPVIAHGTGVAQVDLGTPAGTGLSYLGAMARMVAIDPGTNPYAFTVTNVGLADPDGLPDVPAAAYVGLGTFDVTATLYARMNFTQFLATTLDVGPASGWVTLRYDYADGPGPTIETIAGPPSLRMALTACGGLILARVRAAARRRGRGRPSRGGEPGRGGERVDHGQGRGGERVGEDAGRRRGRGRREVGAGEVGRVVPAVVVG